MIVLENGDLIEGDATNATEVDYTLHGLDNNVLKQLADGQLASSKGTLYTANSTDVVSSIILVNSGAAHNHVNLYLKPSAGTSRRLIAKDLQLESGYSLHFDGAKVMVMNIVGQVIYVGATGAAGTDGDDAYVYIAYASDNAGTDFTLVFDAALNYIAIKTTAVAIPAPAVGDFAGLWKNYKGATGSAGTNGTNGTDGTAATIAVGTVTSGTPAAVTNVGTPAAAVFDFTLVTGATGAQGPSGTLPIAVAAGTVDAITANFTPDLTLSDMMLCAIVASGANVTTTPSFAPDGLTAHTIVKKGGSALVAGDIPGALAVCVLEYNLANTRWELLNPSVTGTTYASAAEELAGASAVKASSPSVSREMIINFKPFVHAEANELDLFAKSSGALPDATNPIKVMIPDGNGYTQRTRAAEYLSGLSRFVMADATNYWSKDSLDAEIKTAYIYAIWDAAGGIVWALGGYSGFTRCPASTTATDDDFFLLEASSTYTKVITDYCVCVGKIRYQYDTADTPDHTIQATVLDAPQVMWNPKSDYGYSKNLATTVTGAANIAEYSAISVVAKQSGKYGVSAHCMSAVTGASAGNQTKNSIKVGSSTYASATYKVENAEVFLSVYSGSHGATESISSSFYANSGDTIHYGILVAGSGGDKTLYGDSSFKGVTKLTFWRID
mgnify:FL=1